MALAMAVTLVSLGIAELEVLIFGYPVLEPLVLALILGVVIRSLWQPPEQAEPGIAFSAKEVLEFAIVLIGFSLALGTLVDAGIPLAIAILTCVVATLLLGIGIGKVAGLPVKLSILIGVGNAICGNSAIAAVAPVIRARKQDVTSAIALTAVLGIGVVLSLPLLIPLLSLTDPEYGVVAGLSVYAVPQVLAATFPVSAAAGQIASLVKLTRVLMLGPCVALFAFLYRDREERVDGSSPGLTSFVPWFVIGFAITVGLRSSGVVPEWLAEVAQEASRVLTAVAMAGLGLSVDVKSVRDTGIRVGGVVVILTALLVTSAVALTLMLGLP